MHVARVGGRVTDTHLTLIHVARVGGVTDTHLTLIHVARVGIAIRERHKLANITEDLRLIDIHVSVNLQRDNISY